MWFIDPDDMMINGAVSYVKKAKELDADILLGNYIKTKEDGSFAFDLSKNDFDHDVVENSEKFAPTDIYGETMSACWAGVFRKSFLVANSLRFNEKIP